MLLPGPDGHEVGFLAVALELVFGNVPVHARQVIDAAEHLLLVPALQEGLAGPVEAVRDFAGGVDWRVLVLPLGGRGSGGGFGCGLDFDEGDGCRGAGLLDEGGRVLRVDGDGLDVGDVDVDWVDGG